MASVDPSRVRLHRPPMARTLASPGFQQFYLLVVLGAFGATALQVLPSAGAAAIGIALQMAGAALPFLVVWLAGFTAWAKVDDTGVSWRYLIPRRYDWRDIEKVEFLSLIWSRSSKIFPRIWVDGTWHTMSPVVQCGRSRKEFGRALRAAAEQHHVPVTMRGKPGQW